MPRLHKSNQLTNGHWKSDGPLRVATLMEAQRPDVDYAGFQKKVEVLVHPGGLSTEDAKEALGHAKSISDKRDDRQDKLGFQTLSTVHEDMTAQLKTPPTLLGHAFDDTSDVIRGRASDELTTVTLRSGYNAETIAKWKKDRLPDYVRQTVGNASDTVKALGRSLPVPSPLTDPKTGFIEQDEIDRAAQRIFQRYKVDPKKYGPLKSQGLIPPELDRALKVLEDIESLNQFQRDTKMKETNREG